MKYYEGGFFANFKYWARYYDTEMGKSFLTDDVPQKWEYYVQDDTGAFTSIYSNKKFRRERGSSNDAKGYGCTSQVSPVDLAIRDQFRNLGNPNPRIFYLDIETRVGTVMKGFPSPDKALEPVSLIQFLDNKTQIVHLIGDREFYYEDWYKKQPDHLGKEIQYHKCNNEIEMFNKFFEFIEDLQPAVVFAWNGEGFDFPYLYNRCKRINQDVSKFSPFWRKFGEKTGEQKGYIQGRSQMFADRYAFDLSVGGCAYIDIKRLYQKIVLAPRTSYSLNSIAEVELKSRKIDHSEFKTFDDFYLGNYTKPEKPTEDQTKTLCYLMTEAGKPEEEIKKAGHGQFVYYGVIDVVLLQEIDKKCGLSALMCDVSNRMNSQFNSVLGTTKPWANYIRNVLFDSGWIIDPETILARGADLEKSILGGFVRDPVTGKHEWVLSADVNSMYPILAIAGSGMSPNNFMFAWELSNEGSEGELKRLVVEHLHVGDPSQEQNEQNLLNLIKNPELKAKLVRLLKETNLTMAPNGVFFRKDKPGFLPELVKNIFKERKVVKKAMFKKEQRAIKLQEILHHR